MPIDSYSDYSLRDVVNDEMSEIQVEDGEVVDSPTTEYRGLHVSKFGDEYTVQPDGYAGEVMRFGPDEYDDVLELIDDLNSEATLFWQELDQDERVEYAGRIMTSDEERAREEPDKYVHIP